MSGRSRKNAQFNPAPGAARSAPGAHRTAGAHLNVAPDLADNELLTARHRKSFGHAAQHHFPTREELVAAAVEYVGEVQILVLRERADELPPGPSRTERVVEMLLNLYAGRLFQARSPRHGSS